MGITTDCLLGTTEDQLQELKGLGFTYTLLDCTELPKSTQLYVRRRRSSLVRSILNAAKRTKNKAYLKLKLKRYKYIANYAKLSISL